MAFLGTHIPWPLRSPQSLAPRSTRASSCRRQAIHASELDAIVIGGGVGGLVTATQLAAKGADVLVLEKYLIPGGSGGYFTKHEKGAGSYTFDAGASMIFGLGDISSHGSTNLITRALHDVGRQIETIPDPVQINYHLPNGLDVKVHKDYQTFIDQLTERFPRQKKGIRAFYDECWTVFNALNALQLLSLEEPAYLLRIFFQNPLACLTLLRYFPANAGSFAKTYITDPELLAFIDMECYLWSVMKADLTPMINAGMVFSDRHYGGINYPKGGVGVIATELVKGLEAHGSSIRYKARVDRILVEDGHAVGVKLLGGEELRAKRIISNATRWDTFNSMVPPSHVPDSEKTFQERYIKSPSFLSLHLGVERDIISEEEDCHHILLEEWKDMELAHGAAGTVFVSIPTLLDDSLAPADRHIFHIFTPCWIDEFEGLDSRQYIAKKEELADRLISRLETSYFPGLSQKIRLREVGSPRTHRKFLGRVDGSYGPVPRKRLAGLVNMPFNRTELPGLYCVGDSAFPGQGLNAVTFSGYACGHRVAVDLGFEPSLPVLGEPLTKALSEWRIKI